jgi:hypothetical protein
VIDSETGRPVLDLTSAESLWDAIAEPEAGAASPGPGAVVIDPARLTTPTKAMRRRRSVPITGYVGLNGNGKSFAMIRDTLPDIRAGVPILSTVGILDPWTGNDYAGYTRLQSWSQVEEFRAGVLLLDEVLNVADARDGGMPKHIRRHLAQFRRAGTRVGWTGIDFDNADKRVRQITQAVVVCRGRFKKLDGPGEVTMWAPNRMFVLTTFDAQTIQRAEDSAMLTEDQHKRRKARVLSREFVWGGAERRTVVPGLWPLPAVNGGMGAFNAYNTMDAVSQVDNLCPICFGKPVERTCRGHDDDGAPTRGRPARASR